MGIDTRAYGWCSLGPLAAEASTFADDQLQGSGIIKTKGTVQLQGIHRPAPGAPVSFGYSDGQNWLARIPRRLRVLSSVPNPLTLTTEVSVGCLFTYFENRKPAMENPTAKAEHSDVPDVVWRATVLPISAAYVFQQCCNTLGLTVSGGIPLTNTYIMDSFDLSAGFIEEMGKLAVSEGWFIRLNEAEQVVFVSKQQEGGSGPLLQRGELIDFNPVNVGDLPGEAVVARYSVARLKAPTIDSDEQLQKRNWERDSSSQTSFALVSYTNQQTGGLSNIVYAFDQFDSTETTYDSSDRVMVRKTRRNTILAAVASSYVGQTSQGGGGSQPGNITTTTTFTYDSDGEVLEELTVETSPFASVVGGAVNQYTFAEGNVTLTMGSITSRVSRVQYSRNNADGVTQTRTTEQVARGQTAWGAAQISEASQLATTASEAQGVLNLAAQLVPGDVVVKTHIGREFGTQKRPSAAARAQINDSKAGANNPTVEEVAQIAWAMGSPAAQTYLELTPPYVPDDRIVFTAGSGSPIPGQFSVIRSDAEAKAINYARIENRLLLGNRNGVGIQILPELMPPAPFSPVYVRLNGCTAEFRTNGTAWTISSEGATSTTDLLFWNAVDATDFANVWFPTAPGVSSLPAAVGVTPSANPLPANAVAIPAGFDLERPDLGALFGSILPSGVAPVWANAAAPAVAYPPFNETVELRGGVGIGGVIEPLSWVPTEVSLVGGVGAGATVEALSRVAEANTGVMTLNGGAAQITAGSLLSAGGGELTMSGAAATITTTGGSSGTRVAGLHLDGTLYNTVGNNSPEGGDLTWITSGQKYGTGAVTVSTSGYIALFPSGDGFTFPSGAGMQNRDFVFRFWVKIPNGTDTAMLAGQDSGDIGYVSFGCRIEAGALIWRHFYNGSSYSQSFGSAPVNTWAFVEIGRVSGVVRGSVNGVVSANTLAMPANSYWGEDLMYLVNFGSTMSVTLDDFEFLTGEGPRTADFTPPTAAFS